MRLLRAELARIVLRRLTWVALAVVVVLIGLMQLQVNDALTPPSPDQQASARAQYDRALEDWQTNHVAQEQQCRADGGTDRDCTIPQPTPEGYGIATPELTEVVQLVTQVVAYLGGLAMFFVAASFIGAEYTSGAIGNWLTFVPRRGRVYAAKLAAVVGAAGVGTIGLLVFGLATTIVLAQVHGVPVSGLGAVAADAGRALAAVVVFAVLGFGLALLGRHTVVALAAFLAYAVVSFIRGVVLSQTVWAARLTPWTPEGNLLALVGNGYTYEILVPSATLGGDPELVEATISAASAGVYFTVVLAVLVVVGLLVFRRRDVS